jgi:methylmalonyl-CoA mutase
MATEERLTVAPIVGPDDPRRFTDSGIEINRLYTEDDLPENLELGEPGAFPYIRGVHPEMYRKRPWTMRQYAGYASSKESNERYKYLLAHGSTGLSMAFDLPTQLGLDSDDPRCLGEVGRTGVSIDTIDDMRLVFDGIPLNEISTSMTINAPATVLLALYSLVGEEQGVPLGELRGTTQNDVLKEYIARGNFIYPPEGTMRLTTDLLAWSAGDAGVGSQARAACLTLHEPARTLRDAFRRVRRVGRRAGIAGTRCRARNAPERSAAVRREAGGLDDARGQHGASDSKRPTEVPKVARWRRSLSPRGHARGRLRPQRGSRIIRRLEALPFALRKAAGWHWPAAMRSSSTRSELLRAPRKHNGSLKATSGSATS